MNAIAQNLLSRLRAHEARVGVIGLGYVGLPVALAFAEKGFPVLGFDVDAAKIEALAAGRSYLRHIDAARVKAARLEATADFARLGEPDAILICVPTPLTPKREPDMTYVEKTAAQIAPRLRRGQLVILESTTYPGTTEELVRVALEKPGLKCGEDFFLAFSPEREDPGNLDFTVTKIPKVVGGVDAVSGDLAQALYDQVVARTVRVSSARAAEATKLLENVFRAVNIALVNELKIVYDKMGIDVWEVLDAAQTKPFGFMRFNPGPGWGGHCIPLDPFYLAWKARQYGVDTKFIELAGELNIAMPKWVVEKLEGAMRAPLKGRKILLLGFAYKKDTDDPRETPAQEIMTLLEEKGARVDYHDPYIPKIPRTRKGPHRAGRASVPLTVEGVAAYDAVIVVTDHTPVDYELVVKHAKLVVDTRGIYARKFPKLRDRVINA